MPFPPPPGKFPPPPGLGTTPAEAKKEAKAGKPATRGAPTGARKKLIIMAGGAIAALVVLGGGFFAYMKFTAEPPPPPPKPKLAVKPPEPVPAPVVETPKVEPAPVEVVTPKPVEPPAPVVVAPPPPPPVASLAFKGWVANLKIKSVRGGETPRVFIGGTTYEIGDLVNPQLGITFEGYDIETRRLTFKDKSGAKVELRN